MTQETQLLISGKVQGVFFRASTKKVASQLKLKGFVSNLIDSRVKIVAVGDAQNIENLIAWCQKGPPAAKVEKVDICRAENIEKFSGFEIR